MLRRPLAQKVSPVRIESLLARLVEFSARRAALVVLAGLIIGLLAVLLSGARLGVTTDLDGMFAASLPWKQHQATFDHAFPQFNDLTVAVIDADLPEEAEATAAGLAKAMDGNPAIHTVTRPDASPFYTKNGLLFLDTKTLGTLLDKTVDAQPFLGQLVADPSARGLFAALGLIGLGVQRGEANIAGFTPSLNSFHATLASVIAGKPQPLSWQRLLTGSIGDLAGQYKFVLFQPKLDYGALEPGAGATAAIRAAAAKLEFVASGHARVRITGSVPLSDEEFATVAQGAVAGLIGSLVLVTLWLFLAVRSWRLIVPILMTLILGLLLTTGFAALAVGTLNLISVAFAILFVGIAVDFAIQFSVRFREMRLRHGSAEAALSETARRVGIQILVAALATAAGFLAFVPTSFSGVAQLGLIAGIGMLIAFACTLTFLPACLSLCRPRAEAGEIGFTSLRPADAALVRFRFPIVIIFAVLAALGAAGTTQLQFDADPLHTKNPHTEAMTTLADLMANPITNPYTIDALLPDLAAADAAGRKAKALPLTAQILTLTSLVPGDQPAKLALIADTANLLTSTLSPRTAAAPITPGDLRLAGAHHGGRFDQGRRHAAVRECAGSDRRGPAGLGIRPGRHAAGGQYGVGALPAAAVGHAAVGSGRAARDRGQHPAGHQARLGAARRPRPAAGHPQAGGWQQCRVERLRGPGDGGGAGSWRIGGVGDRQRPHHHRCVRTGRRLRPSC